MSSDNSREVQELAKDKFMALPDMYKHSDGVARYCNMDDVVGSIRTEEWVTIARWLRDGDELSAGVALRTAVMRILIAEADDELEDC